MIVTQTPPPATGVGLGLRWAFLDEVLADEVPASINFFEISPENYMRRGGYIPDALTTVASRFPLLTHGLMLNIGGTTPPSSDYLDQLRDFLQSLNIHQHSDHLCWTGHAGRCLHDLFPLPLDRTTAAHVADQVRRVQDHLQVPLALENISYYASPGLRRSSPEDLPKREAAFVCEILERADCRMLLDVNNVHVNGHNLGFDPLAFLSEIPLARVQSLHVAGGEVRPHLDGLLIDTHGSDVLPAVHELMAWVIERVGPRPVVYERDHNIPELAELGRQVAQLQQTYDDALLRFHAAMDPSHGPTDIHTLPGEVIDLHSASHGLSQVVLDADATRYDAVFFAEHGLAPDASEVMASLGSRLEVYRKLSRATISSVVENFLPRTIARLPAGSFEREFVAWMAGPGPRSPYLRDLPQEFVQWASPRWAATPEIATYLVDLARHELVEFTVATATAATAHQAGTFSLQSVLQFVASSRLLDYDHRVHELPSDVDDRTVPKAQATSLLVYRDGENHVRYLELTPLARAVTGRLMAGRTVQEAVITGAQEVGQALDPDVLGRMSLLLADFAERGLVEPAAQTSS